MRHKLSCPMSDRIDLIAVVALAAALGAVEAIEKLNLNARVVIVGSMF